MAITQNNIESGKKFMLDKMAKNWVKWVRVSLDSSYPSGGYGASQGFSPGAFGFKSLSSVQVVGWNGTSGNIADLSYDYANKKLVALNSASPTPALIVEEVVTITSNAGRLSRVPGYIIAIQVTGTTSGAGRIIPTGKTTASLQVAVNFVTGAVATFATDAVTSLKVTYIPLGVGNFTSANRVVDEAVTLASAGVNLANRAAVIQYIWNDTDTTHLPAMQPVGEAPGNHEVTLDINNTGASTITPNASQDTNSALVTYFKYDATWISNHNWTDDADITITSTSLFAIADDPAVPPQGIWIPGYGVVIVGEATTTNKQAVIQGPQGSAGANVAVYNPIAGKIALTAGDGYTTFAVPYVFLNSAQNVISTSSQVPTGTNLSGVTVDLRIEGRPL